MRIILIGKGRMGQKFKELFQDEVVINVDKAKEIEMIQEKADVIIDFSHASLLKEILALAKRLNLPLVLATTGYTISEISLINDASIFIPICQDYNFSYGMMNFKKILKVLMNDQYEKIEIIETHHINKKDSPSGTALLLRNIILKHGYDPKITSIRKGDNIGIHQINLYKNGEVIEIKHKALDRKIFVEGAYKAALALQNKTNGFYSFEEAIYE